MSCRVFLIKDISYVNITIDIVNVPNASLSIEIKKTQLSRWNQFAAVSCAVSVGLLVPGHVLTVLCLKRSVETCKKLVFIV